MPFAMQTWLAGKLKCWNSTFVYQWKFSFQVPASIAGKCGGQVGNQSFPEDPEAYVGLTCFLPELFDSEVKLWPKMPWPQGVQQSEVDEGLRAVAAALLEGWGSGHWGFWA